jgi:drug/metabolite transporter (DMT)-like permease
LFLRGVLSSLLIAAALWWLGHWRLPVPRADRRLIAMRSLSEIVATIFFLTALFNMPLANVIALLQMLPLTVTLAGAVVLREPVGWRRMVAIMIGFCGMLLIVRPGSSGFNVYTIYALLAVICVTFRDLSTRQMSPQVPSLVITFASSAGLTVLAALASLGKTWVQPDWHLSGLIVLSALFIFAGYCSSVMVMVMVMRVGELSAVTLFRYTSLLWALLLGWLMFDEWPTALTFLGVVIVAATGLYTLYRESKLSRWGRKYLQDVIAINRKASLKQGFTRRIETGHVEELWHRNLY